MFKNLKAEQARNDMSNTDTAQILGLSRVSYETKMKNGRFTVTEAKKLCEHFGCSFEYLFETK